MLDTYRTTNVQIHGALLLGDDAPDSAGRQDEEADAIDRELCFSGRQRNLSEISMSFTMERANDEQQYQTRERLRLRPRQQSIIETELQEGVGPIEETNSEQEPHELDVSLQSLVRLGSGQEDRSIRTDASKPSILEQSQSRELPDQDNIDHEHSENDRREDIDRDQTDEQDKAKAKDKDKDKGKDEDKTEEGEEEPKSRMECIMAAIVGAVTAIYGAFCVFQKCCQDDDIPVDAPGAQPDPGT